MAKSLDGIKKLNPDDIKKYRQIVLNYIGEKDSAAIDEQKKSSGEALLARKVDGVNVNKANYFAAKGREAAKKALVQGETAGLPVRQIGVLSGTKEELLKSRQREEERLREVIKRQEEERKKIKEEERQYRAKKEQAEKDRRRQEEGQRQEKIKLEKERIMRGKAKQQEIKLAEESKKWAEKLRLEELEEEKQRRARENVQLEKMKRAEEIKMIKQEMKIKKQAAREKKRIKRRKDWRKIRKSLNFKLNIVFPEIKQNIIYIVSFSALFLAIAYIVFCLAVLRFNNNFIGWAANYLPVPAVVTSQGIISYNDFQKIAGKSYLNLSLFEKKNYLAEWVVLRGLREKYRYSDRLTGDDLAIKYVLDKDFNQAGLSRISKINELLNGQSLIEQLSKYADEYNGGAYYSQNAAVEKFGPTVLALVVGQTSQVIPRTNGYYIVERIDDKNGQLGLKYLFVNSLTLAQYVSEETRKIKVFILAN